MTEADADAPPKATGAGRGVLYIAGAMNNIGGEGISIIAIAI